jgi:hypothetical protein
MAEGRSFLQSVNRVVVRKKRYIVIVFIRGKSGRRIIQKFKPITDQRALAEAGLGPRRKLAAVVANDQVVPIVLAWAQNLSDGTGDRA